MFVGCGFINYESVEVIIENQFDQTKRYCGSKTGLICKPIQVIECKLLFLV